MIHTQRYEDARGRDPPAEDRWSRKKNARAIRRRDSRRNYPVEENERFSPLLRGYRAQDNEKQTGRRDSGKRARGGEERKKDRQRRGAGNEAKIGTRV